jgi:nicotinate phosphoribosyltransferase
MVVAAGDRPVIEMGSRRTNEYAAVTAARAAYLGGFAATSNLEAGRRYGVPTAGTSAHSFVLLHDDEEDAFRAQVEALGPDTTLLVDTYDISRGVRTAVKVAGPALGAVRIDSGELTVLAHETRALLDELGNTGTRIVVSGDLDEYAIAALAAAPVDSYGAGTAVVTGSGAPTAGMVYKLVEVDGRPVAKRSQDKQSRGGRKYGVRRHRPSGTATEEVVRTGALGDLAPGERPLQVPLMREGKRVAGLPTLDDSRDHLRRVLVTVPWDGMKLSRGEPAIPTVFEEVRP